MFFVVILHQIAINFLAANPSQLVDPLGATCPSSVCNAKHKRFNETAQSHDVQKKSREFTGAILATAQLMEHHSIFDANGDRHNVH